MPHDGRSTVGRIPQVDEATPSRGQGVPLDKSEPESLKESHVPEHGEGEGGSTAICCHPFQARGCERRANAHAPPFSIDGETIQVPPVANEPHSGAAHQLALRLRDNALARSEAPSTRPSGDLV